MIYRLDYIFLISEMVIFFFLWSGGDFSLKTNVVVSLLRDKQNFGVYKRRITADLT